ncbi:nucleotide exchange factor GrpE [Candidatus Kaiserbacteria bacterium RIFCSPHIGHO2_02_FULL_49_11]|uniref:Protein GrpE n=1 Tax=Candidatus Kaiserbacteria bacterium RIFCSPHIGHO2_02_FULL_49_11 TaxID=1798489 RepID=A0A1F6CYY3_9BACT|nr:MAG: nucleotide exchange factor GrpE [Candidatus Kaiserbacteria bacterium RIFCSPHIGHO2_02_FULL_49_11]
MPKKKISKIDTENEVDQNVDDIVAEDELGTTTADALKKLRKRLKECEQERQEYLLGWQRARADAVNREREWAKESARVREAQKEDLVRSFLPLFDSFDMAFANQEAWNKVEKDWRVGVEYIYAQALKALQSEGVTVIDAVGEMYDPTIHEPIETQAVSSEAENERVVAVVQKGYRLNNRVIRPAKIIIGTYTN